MSAAQNNRDTSRRYYDRNRENGLCGHCGRPSRKDGVSSRCQKCWEKGNRYRYRVRKMSMSSRVRGGWCANRDCLNKRLVCESYCEWHLKGRQQ